MQQKGEEQEAMKGKKKLTSIQKPLHKHAGRKVVNGRELIGELITVRWRRAEYPALVIGYKRKKHKLYYPSDRTTEVCDLTDRSWRRDNPIVPGWNRDGLVGRRIVLVEKWDDLDDEPYEAFVVNYVEPYKYRVLYTQDDSMVVRNLGKNKMLDWELLDKGQCNYKGRKIGSWSK